jgi:Jhy protein
MPVALSLPLPNNAHQQGLWSYRYWQLGSLGPHETLETIEKRSNAERAKAYGTAVGERVKATAGASTRRAPLPPSKNERAREFAKTIKPPRGSPKAASDDAASGAPRGAAAGGRLHAGAKNVTRQAGAAPTGPKQAAAAPVRGETAGRPPRRTVSKLLELHDSAARKAQAIRADIERWETEDTKSAAQSTARAAGSTRRKSPACGAPSGPAESKVAPATRAEQATADEDLTNAGSRASPAVRAQDVG